MKKILCLVLALLCLSAYAMAESVPSKNTSDMVSVEIDATSNPDLPVDSGLVVLPVLEEDEAHATAYAEPIALCQEEIAKLAENVAQSEESAETSGVEAYFGEVHDSEGNVVVLSEALAAQTLDVFEFMPLIVENYEDTYGDVTLTFQFKTPYAEGEELLVLVGIRNSETGEIAWTAFEGVGIVEEGSVQVVFTPEIMDAIQNNMALLAVVSAGEVEEAGEQ